MSRNNPKDYTLNKEAAQSLADKIKQYWHTRGHLSVDAWVEVIPIYNPSSGKRIATRFEINSNIIQSVSSLENGHVTRV